RVLGRLGAPDVHLGHRAGDDHLAGVAVDHDHVVISGAFDGDGVGRAVAGGAARRGRQVQVDLGDVGAGQGVDGDAGGAAQGDEVDRLGAVDVHDDVGDVAGEEQPVAVGREVDLLGDVGAVELQGVEAGLALDDVAAVARVPRERVVARPHQGRVVARAAEDQ